MFIRRIVHCFSILLALSLLHSCASKHTQFRDPKNTIINTKSDTLTYRSVFLLGNLGSGKTGPNETLLQAFNAHQKQMAKKDDYLLILGDNVYANKLNEGQNKQQLERIVSLTEAF